MLRTFFTTNLRAKGMALVMAFTLWFYAISRHTDEIKGDIPLMIYAPPGLTILETSSKFATVNLIGPQNTTDKISAMIRDNRIESRVDVLNIGNVEKGNIRKTIRLTRRNFDLPKDIRVTSIVPNEIEVVLGQLESKYLKVQLQKRGAPAPGHEITSEFFYPNTVLVTGPVNILNESDTINTSVIDIGGITREQNRTFPWTVNLEDSMSIIKDDKQVSALVQCDEKVNVWFQVSEQVDVRMFEKLKVNVFHPVDYEHKIKLKEEYIDLSLKGPKLMLDMLSADDIMVYIDVSSLLPPGPYNQPIICNIPEGFKIEGIPPEVHVDIVEAVVESE